MSRKLCLVFSFPEAGVIALFWIRVLLPLRTPFIGFVPTFRLQFECHDLLHQFERLLTSLLLYCVVGLVGTEHSLPFNATSWKPGAKRNRNNNQQISFNRGHYQLRICNEWKETEERRYRPPYGVATILLSFRNAHCYTLTLTSRPALTSHDVPT